MTPKHRRTLGFRLRVALAAALLVGGLAPAAGAELTCTALPQYMRLFLRAHVTYDQLTPELRERAIDAFVVRLDPSRSLLTEPEAAAMRRSLSGIVDDARKGDCEKLNEAHAKIIRAHEWAAKFVRSVVEDEAYVVDEQATLVLDPDDRGYPASKAERKDLLRRMVHFQMSNYLGNDTPVEQARDKLIKRYERRLTRALDESQEDIYSEFLDAFATALDPHSNYLSREVLEDFRIGMSLSLEGIGVALSEQDGYAVAERIIPGGAADRHGVLRPKDKIIAVAQDGIDFIDIVDMPLRDAVGLIRGKAGTTVGLTILRQGDKAEKFTTEIVRDKIDLAEQAAKLDFIEHDLGEGKTFKLAVLELPSFYGDANPAKRQCTDDVARLLGEVNESGADGLVLDLSRNGGGLLQHAVTISGFFIREGDVVGITDSKGRRQVLSDRDERVLYAGPLVVLTSRVSASASEILAGALKDYGRAVIVGDDHTFGKGTVQTVSQLPGGDGALKITTALFFRPGGLSTQHSGVAADIVLPSQLASDDYGEKTQRYSLKPQRTSPFLSDSVNGVEPHEHWEPVGGETLGLLAERSRSRVKASTAFDELLERIAEAEERNGVVVVAELMERRQREAEEAEQTEESPEQAAPDVGGDPDGAPTAATGGAGTGSDASEEEDEPTPQLQEALAVLSDLVDHSRQRAAARDASRPES